MAALLAGQSVSATAKEYNIPKGTVSSWRKQAAGVVSKVTQKKQDVGELILGLLLAELTTLKQMTEAFADEKWIYKQNAADVAVLYGVMQDKAFRKLEALSASSSDD
jgi:transposase-like protein